MRSSELSSRDEASERVVWLRGRRSTGTQEARIESVPSTDATVDAAPRRRAGFGSWLARVILALLFVVGLLFSVFPQGRTAARVALLFPSIISVSAPPPLKLLGSPIQHTSLILTAPPEPVYLDVYAPATPAPPVPGSREGIVVISGVGDNRSDPQLVNLSESFARAGIVVMDVTTPTLLAYDMSPADGTAVVEAFERLSRWPGVSPHRVGIFGLSAGGAIASLAAANPRIRDQVAFLTLFGGYFDATTMLGDFGRRALLIDGRLQPWQPDEVSIQVLANIIAGVLPPAEGSAVVKSVAPGGKLLSARELAGFSPAAVAAYHLLAGDERSPAQVN